MALRTMGVVRVSLGFAGPASAWRVPAGTRRVRVVARRRARGLAGRAASPSAMRFHGRSQRQ